MRGAPILLPRKEVHPIIEQTLLCLDRVVTESLASDPDAFARQQGVTLRPHTSTAAAIVQLARDSRPALRVVRALRYPWQNASCRVLAKTGRRRHDAQARQNNHSCAAG